MANHPSAKKRNRQNIKRNARNAALRSRMRKAIKAARLAIENDEEDKHELVLEAVASVYRTKSKRVIKSNKASRTVSRLMRAVGEYEEVDAEEEEEEATA